MAHLLVRFDQVARFIRKRESQRHVSGYKTSRSRLRCYNLARAKARYRKGPFSAMTSQTDHCFLQLAFRLASFPTPNCALRLKAKFSDEFGQQLRLTAQCPT
jgi:hypothetical protein